MIDLIKAHHTNHVPANNVLGNRACIGSLDPVDIT